MTTRLSDEQLKEIVEIRCDSLDLVTAEELASELLSLRQENKILREGLWSSILSEVSMNDQILALNTQLKRYGAYSDAMIVMSYQENDVRISYHKKALAAAEKVRDGVGK